MKNLICLLSAVILLSATISAQGFAVMGTIEYGGTVSFSNVTRVADGVTDDNSRGTLSLQPYIGIFPIDGFEIGLIPAFTISSYKSMSTIGAGVYLAPSYNFILEESRMYPFIEGRIGYTYQNIEGDYKDFISSGLSFGGRGGVKLNLGKSSLLNVALEYMMVTLNPDDVPDEDGRYGYNQFAASIGLTVFFNSSNK